jgi:cbb3-type cytochrome oxidase maturation protein
MEALYLLVPLSIAIVFLAIWVFFQMSDSGQFDDMIGPGLRVLMDDDAVQPESEQGADKNIS